MEQNIDIRIWNESDFPIVRKILLDTWLDTYSSFIPVEDINSYLESSYNVEKLKLILENPESSGLIIESGIESLGFMRISISKTENRFYISSLYILPEYQGLGLGKSLLSKAKEEAAARGYTSIYLGVMKQNVKSLKWYENHGFIFNEELPFQMGKTSVPHLIGQMKI